MADEARKTREFGETFYAADGTVTPYEVRQGAAGAEVYTTATAKTAGQYPRYETRGQFKVKKSSSVQFVKGQRVYWDHSADAATYLPVNDRDFYLGRAAEDAAGSAPTVEVLLNEDPPYDVDLKRDGFQSVLVGTVAAGGFGYPVNLGGALVFELDATNEAQKVDALSVKGFAVDSNACIEIIARVLSDGAAGAQDVSIGAANGTHASDFQTVGEFVALHLDGGTVNINAQSDDGTTDVAPTDTTVDYTEGTDAASRFHCIIDLRNPSDAQIIVNGALVLEATTFTLANATGPLYLIVHLEKTVGTDTYKLAVDELRAWLSEQ